MKIHIIHLLIPLFLFIFTLPSKAEKWPDGSLIDRWYSTTTSKIPSIETRPFVVTEYGVTADDSTLLQTESIQKVINMAAESGGGTIVIPQGTFLISSLFFKPHTHLRIDEGGVLKGSDDISDYPIAQVHIEGVKQNYIAALINAYENDGFSITGKGCINGNGLRYWKAFWKRKEVNRNCTNLEALRPRMMYIANCNNVHIKGISLQNSAFWNIHLYKSNFVHIEGISIFAPNSPVKAPSSDGIDIDACNDVYIHHCNISVNDDIVAIKGGKGPWADKDPDNGTNSRILIEHNYFGKGPGVLTLGSECIGGNNIILRHCEVHGANRLLWLKMRPDTPQTYENILIDNIKGEADCFLFVHPWKQFFDLKDRKDIPMSYGKNITLQNCTLKCKKERDIVDAPTQFKLSNITLRNNKLTIIK